MPKRIKCDLCSKEFFSEGSLNSHTKMKHSKGREKKPKKIQLKDYNPLIKKAFIFLILILGGAWVYLLITTSPVLPPTTMQGHVEAKPASHILKKAMGLAVQKHMLEHADGKGPRGIIINYNCEDFKCSPALIEKLEKFALNYPDNVYVAPFPKMSSKIVLTKPGKMERMEEYSEEQITNFILTN